MKFWLTSGLQNLFEIRGVVESVRLAFEPALISKPLQVRFTAVSNCVAKSTGRSVGIAVAATAFRRGEVWSWWALLIANTIAYGSAMTYDRMVGFIWLDARAKEGAAACIKTICASRAQPIVTPLAGEMARLVKVERDRADVRRPERSWRARGCSGLLWWSRMPKP